MFDLAKAKAEYYSLQPPVFDGGGGMENLIFPYFKTKKH